MQVSNSTALRYRALDTRSYPVERAKLLALLPNACRLQRFVLRLWLQRHRSWARLRRHPPAPQCAGRAIRRAKLHADLVLPGPSFGLRPAPTQLPGRAPHLFGLPIDLKLSGRQRALDPRLPAAFTACWPNQVNLLALAAHQRARAHVASIFVLLAPGHAQSAPPVSWATPQYLAWSPASSVHL